MENQRQSKKEEILLHPHDHKKIFDWINILNFLDSNIDYSTIGTALDLGAGLGNISFHILKKNNQCVVIAEDDNPAYLDIISKRNPDIKVLLHDINTRLPLADTSIDFVSCTGTLHYPCVTDPEKILEEMVRVSKKYILLDFIYKYRFWAFATRVKYPTFNPQRYTAREVNHLIGKHHLKIVKRMGTRIPFGRFFPSFGRDTLFLLEKNE